MNMKKKKILKRVLISLAVVIVLLLAVAGIYLADYRKPDDSALKAINNPVVNVTVTQETGWMAFAPDAATDRAIIFYPGAKGRYDAYATIAEKLAQNNIMCILVDAPLNMSLLDVNAADKVKPHFPEIKHWYIGGHSMGGSAAEQYVKKHQRENEGLIMVAIV